MRPDRSGHTQSEGTTTLPAASQAEAKSSRATYPLQTEIPNPIGRLPGESVLRRPSPVKAKMHRPAPQGGGPGLDWCRSPECLAVKGKHPKSRAIGPALAILETPLPPAEAFCYPKMRPTVGHILSKLTSN